MEQAIERLRTVPEIEQDRLALFLLNELEESERWLRSSSAPAVDAIVAASVAAAATVLPPEDFSDWED